MVISLKSTLAEGIEEPRNPGAHYLQVLKPKQQPTSQEAV